MQRIDIAPQASKTSTSLRKNFRQINMSSKIYGQLFQGRLQTLQYLEACISRLPGKTICVQRYYLQLDLCLGDILFTPTSASNLLSFCNLRPDSLRSNLSDA